MSDAHGTGRSSAPEARALRLAGRHGARGRGGRRGGRRAHRAVRWRSQAAAARRPHRHHGGGVRAVDEPARHRSADGGLGAGAAGDFRAAGAEDHARAGGVPAPWRGHQSPAGLRLCRIELRLRSARRQGSLAADHDVGARARGREVRRGVRVSGPADDHLHRRALRHPLLLRRHAGHRAACSR